MTREEAIKILKSKMDGSIDTSYEWVETVRMAIKALEMQDICAEMLESAKPVSTDGDLISRQAAIENLPKVYSDPGFVYRLEYKGATQKMLAELPSADKPTVDKEYLVDLIQEAVYDGEACAKLMDMVDRPTGEWIEVNHVVDTTCECSECHHRDYIPNVETGTDKYECMDRYWFERKFCPNCGAKMKV